MSRVISFRDLRLIPELGKLNEIQLLHPANDDAVNYFLELLGFSVNAGVMYVPNNHRDMQGKVGVGFRAVGDIAPSSRYASSNMCTLVERLVSASYRDMSLAKEMAMMMGNSINFMAMNGFESGEGDEEFPPELIEEDYEDVAAQIKALESLRDQIRGPSLNDYGNPKTPQEYKEYVAAVAA